MTALMWICYSERPLGAEELCQALSVEIGSTDCNDNNTPTIQTVLSCCQGLAVVDEEERNVRLICCTLCEYLKRHRNLFRSPHAIIAETCLTYLNSEQVMALSDSRSLSTQHSSFLEYSSLYWGVHMKKELSHNGKTLALKLLSRYESHISIEVLLDHMLDQCAIHSIEGLPRLTGLHCASIFGLIEVVGALIEMGGDINGMDETGSTSLIWAAKSGQDVVVKLLLGQGDVNPDGPDYDGRTTLSWAAGNGHEAVVNLLLRRQDVNPDWPDIWGRTPISWAAGNGHEAMVKLLLGREDVNPDRLDELGRTPISWATKNEHEGVVKLLLGHKDINPNKLGVEACRTQGSC